MPTTNPLDALSLVSQIKLQRKHMWNIEKDIPWEQGIDPTKYFLPLDKDAIVFPHANADQRLVLSQLMGLVINSTISEMEGVIHKLKDLAWEQILRSYPANPEMWELGELFFKEEKKHSVAFARYIEMFCETTGIRNRHLDHILPKAFGSIFQKAIIANAKAGGHAFWWVVATVEEVSIEIYKQMHHHKTAIDPLFYTVHRRHAEEESRHRNYAFLMLDLVRRRMPSLQRFFHKRTDLLFAQAFSTGWIVTELHKVFYTEKLSKAHPFFATVSSCLPLIKAFSIPKLFEQLFVRAPYISLVLNTRNQVETAKMARRHKALSLPLPKVKLVPTYTKAH